MYDYDESERKKISLGEKIIRALNSARGGNTLNSANKRPMKISHKIIISCISVALVLCLCVSGILTLFLGRLDRVSIDQMKGSGGEWKTIYEIVDSDAQNENSPYEEVDHLDEVSVVEGDAVFDKEISNILLIGADSFEGTSRSDSMMLVSIDNRNKKIKITSLMRDMYVAIPNKSSNKLNAAYCWGGAKLLVETIEYNFKIKIDNVIRLDFTAFKTLIDKMGGLTIELNEKQVKYMNKYAHTTYDSPGTYKVSGKVALEYVRMRKIDSDFGRTRRQRDVFEQIFDRISDYNIIDLTMLTYDMLQYIQTDISNKEIRKYLTNAPALLDYKIEQFSLPAKDTYEGKSINGADVLVLDVDENAKRLSQFVYSNNNIFKDLD